MNWLLGRSGVIPLLVILCITCITSCSALYEDQVGVWDWHQQYIGKVTHAAFQTHGSGRKRVVVATESNCIASLNLRTGEIYWRRVLGETEKVHGLEISLGKYVVSFSGDKGSLRAWHLPDGALFWESFLQPSGGLSSSLLVLPIDINGDRANDLVVFSGGFLAAVSSTDGSTLWKVDFASKDYIIQNVFLSAEGKLLGVGLWKGTNGLVVTEIDRHSGHLHEPSSNRLSTALSTNDFLVVNGAVVALDATLSTLVTAWVHKGSEVDIIETPLSKLGAKPGPDEASSAKLLPTKLEEAVVIEVNRKLILVQIDQTNGLVRALEEFPDTVSISNTLELVEGKHAMAVIQPANTAASTGEFSMRVVYTKNWKENIVQDSVKLALHRGFIKKVFLNAYLRTDRSYGFRALVVGEDDSLSLLQQGEVVWVREDGLATIVDTITSELPLEIQDHAVVEAEHDIMDWLKGHFLKLKGTLFLANPEEVAEIKAMRLNSVEKTKMIRDHNGFRKLLIVLTSAGKVLALHSGDGRVVWSVLLSSMRSQPSGAPFPILKLLPWQIPHQHALDENPVALVFGQADQGIVSWVDLRTGVELRSLNLDFRVELVIPLPFTTATEQRLHMLIDDQLTAHVLPTTQESLELFTSAKSNIYFYVVNKEESRVDGYTIKGKADSGAGGVADGYAFQTQRIWSIVFPAETELISTVVSRRADEVVHTQTKILGNRDAWYKYLSKNLIFVATVTPKASRYIGEATPEEAGLVAYLIDTVTGRVLHRVPHPSMQGPVHAVFSENWVVYHYFNLKMYQYEMSVMELYDENRLRDKGALQLMLGRHNGSAPVSSFVTPSIDVKMLSYFFAFTVKTMTVTSTARGITGKQLLIGTVNDQVLALDKRFFDPRRSVQPAPSEAEEGILPLTEGIPILPQSYITHSYQVAGLRGISTIPASLESTSLVFAYGLDLFYTQTAPSRTYDSLTEDFSYALLLITILALVIGIAVTYIWSEHKELGEKWK